MRSLLPVIVRSAGALGVNGDEIDEISVVTDDPDLPKANDVTLVQPKVSLITLVQPFPFVHYNTKMKKYFPL